MYIRQVYARLRDFVGALILGPARLGTGGTRSRRIALAPKRKSAILRGGDGEVCARVRITAREDDTGEANIWLHGARRRRFGSLCTYPVEEIPGGSNIQCNKLALNRRARWLRINVVVTFRQPRKEDALSLFLSFKHTHIRNAL